MATQRRQAVAIALGAVTAVVGFVVGLAVAVAFFADWNSGIGAVLVLTLVGVGLGGVVSSVVAGKDSDGVVLGGLAGVLAGPLATLISVIFLYSGAHYVGDPPTSTEFVVGIVTAPGSLGVFLVGTAVSGMVCAVGGWVGSVWQRR